MVTDARDSPPDLNKARCAQTTGEHGKEPAVSLGELADDKEEDTPH
jgi:hypothetical protein